MLLQEMYDNAKHVLDTFGEEKLPEYLLQAQWAEFIELKKAIVHIYERKETPLKILDIGIGDARILRHLVGIEEIWNAIEQYDGIDVAQNCVDIAHQEIKKLNISKKASVRRLDAVDLDQIDQTYDIVISTWFTVGNFYPFDFDFATFTPGYDMSKNDKLTKILTQAYSMITHDGELIIGSMYIDSQNGRKHQEDAYRFFGWQLITDERDCFSASKEGWWSQRFTQQRVHDYLPEIPKAKFQFISLDTYNFAMMVRIKK